MTTLPLNLVMVSPMNVMDAATGKVQLSQATRNNFALFGEAYLSCFAQIWCDPRASDLANAAVGHQIRARHVETLIGPQEDRASRPDYIAGGETMDGIMDTALRRNGQHGFPVNGL
jgi:hypothetical protein